MQFTDYIQISIFAVFVNNLVLSRFLGLCPFFGVSKKLSSALGMGIAVIFVLTMASAITWPLYEFILKPLEIIYLRTIVFILVIASLVQFVEMVLQKHSPVLYESLGIFLPLITTNCAILGVAILNTQVNEFTGNKFAYPEALVNAVMSGIGFTLALVLMAGIREKMEMADIPKAMKGLPSAFISAGLMAIAFLGFSGLSFF
ncbi:MAG: electron transport complex protein RnfA [Chitinivibrionales bacterium]